MSNEKQLETTTKVMQNYFSDISDNLKGYNEGANVKEFLMSASLMISENNELKGCLNTPAGKNSLYKALKYGVITGLSLNPQEGKAALIAYNGNVQYQIMKNGLIELAMKSGKVQSITSDTVRENDDFKIVKSPDTDTYTFSPARKNRGAIDGFFAATKLTNGICHLKYMAIEEVKAHRDSYSALFKAKPALSPWTKSFEGMALKTVIKALFRSLSISPQMDQTVGMDDKIESEDDPIDVTPTTPDDKPTDSEELKEKIEEKVETEKKAEAEAAEPEKDNHGELDIF